MCRHDLSKAPSCIGQGNIAAQLDILMEDKRNTTTMKKHRQTISLKQPNIPNVLANAMEYFAE